MNILHFLFLISSGLIIHTLTIYYFLLKLFKQNHYRKDDNILPGITLIISAYNEEKNIEAKLINTQTLDYPLEKLHVIVADDGSSDKTVSIAQKFEFVDILELDHLGKTNAQNQAVKAAQNEILGFSDANNIYKQDALKKLVRHFVDERIGVVCGELQYNHKLSEENMYWRYEVAIKKSEGKNGWLLGANGSIYALRKDAYVPLPVESISDHLEPIMVYGNGLDTIYEPKAIAIEDTPTEVLQRKRRIILRSLVSMKYILPLLNPFHKRSIFIPYFSHKLIRWFLPYLLLICFITSLYLSKDDSFFRIVLFFQIGFYSLGLVHSGIRYIIKVNIASAMAIVDWILGKKRTTWNVVR